MALKVIFIGTGWRGRHWIRRVAAHRLFEPVAIVDPDPAARQAVAEEFGELGLAPFEEVRSAAREVEAQVAIIAAVSWCRQENGLEALEAGWHLLVEKPFALSLEKAATIVRAGEEAGRVISVGQNFRFWPEVGTMQRLVAGGELGELGCGVLVRHRRRYAGTTFQKSMRHGYLWEMGAHDVDLIRFTLGLKPLQVSGCSFRPPWGDYEGETAVSVLCEFEGGVRVSYFGAWPAHIPEFHWRLDGSRLSLRFSEDLECGSPEEGKWEKVRAIGQFGGDDALLDELAVAIQKGGETSTSGRDNLWTVAMMEAVVQSTRAGGAPIDIVDLVRSTDRC